MNEGVGDEPARTIRRLAIVNRGEPAMRLLNAVAELRAEGRTDLRTIALFTEADRSAWFVRAADEAVCLGPAVVTPTGRAAMPAYLDLPRVEAALLQARADAVWVGWGFVSEQADFVDLCDRLDITFIGPDAAVMRRLGDKIASKELAEHAGVPVVPWSRGPVDDVTTALAAAERIGYPIVVKATAGGGGRGIRRAENAAGLPAAFESARAEAAHAFGNPTVFLERQVEGGRHIEVQVIADRYGTVWAPGIRDCSIQRHHQKVLEESNSTALTAAQADELREAACRLCRAAGYVNAGTVEFLYDPADGVPRLMEVNARLQVEHPVTELTTGLDLVKLQLLVAEGGRLEGEPPPITGHAVEVRLTAEEPANDFMPAPGRMTHLRLPLGPGIRVDTGVNEGDDVPPQFDSMIAKLIAWGHDRPEALSRLSRAIEQTTAVVDGGTTSKTFLLSLVNHPDVRAGRLHTGWLDEAMARGDFVATRYRAEALLVAAVEAANAKSRLMRSRFFAAAARGRPEPAAHQGQTVQFRFAGGVHRMRVLRRGPAAYEVQVSGRRIRLQVEEIGEFERRLTVGDRHLRVTAVVQGPVSLIEVEGVSHRILSDEGGVIRSPAPGVVVALPVQPGDQVQAGDTVAVVEMMKLETSISAPFAGRVRAVPATLNVQVDARSRLVELEAESGTAPAADGPAVNLADLANLAELADGEPGIGEGEPGVGGGGQAEVAARRSFGELRDHLLGYDGDQGEITGLLAGQQRAYADLPAGSALLRHAEDELLEVFASLCAVSGRAHDPSSDAGEMVRSPEQYLLTYLRAPAREGEGLPGAYLVRLRDVLRHYGVNGLAPSLALDDALVLLFQATQRLADEMPLIAAVLDRRRADRRWLSGDSGVAAADAEAERVLLDDLIQATEGRYATVADLAREVRFRWYDEPVLEAARSAMYAEARTALQRLQEHPPEQERLAWLARLVAAPYPLRPVMLEHFRGADRTGREAVLESAVRRYYRIRHLSDLTCFEADGHQLCSARFEEPEGPVHLVLGYADSSDLSAMASAVNVHLRSVPAELRVMVDVHVWHDGRLATAEIARRLFEERVGTAWLGDADRRLHRLSAIVSETGSETGAVAEQASTYHFTYRRASGLLVEDPLYRNLHPMLAERLDLWRLSNFALERLDSVEDVYLFRGVARTNPKDERLFALAEVRDLTPTLDADGQITGLPLMERIYLEALSAIRHYQSHRSPAERLLLNELILYVRPPWTVPASLWQDLAHRQAAAARGLGLDEVIVRVRMPSSAGKLRQQELLVSSPAGGVVVRQAPPERVPIPVLTEYEWRALQTRRRGSHYPYDIVQMLTPPELSSSDFPPGDFVEYDLIADVNGADRLEPVDREYGRNASNIVVGVIRNVTREYPEGMSRVMVLGDPSRGMGNLAEGECRRIIAACDLAERLRVPVEWFAVSAGAKISMTSGTENMDWIAAVLRRLVQFTQAEGEINILVTGINVGAQPYWNAESTMLMHTRGVLVMIPESAMVLTGKTALDFSGGVSAEDNLGIGGYERIMGPNGQAQYYAPDLEGACTLLLRHYAHTYVVSGERFPRRAVTEDPADRDVCSFPHARVSGDGFATVGEVFSASSNAERKKPFDIRSVMRAVTDADSEPLERWSHMRNAEGSAVWDARIGGIPICLIGFESHPLPREGFIPADGPTTWTSGTLFPQSARKTARAINGASGNRPLVVLANLSGFDGSPESMRLWQLEYGAEIGRAVTNFAGPIVFVVVSRYHGGAFVVFSKRLNPSIEAAAIEGSYASVIGGAPAAAVVFTHEVNQRTRADERVASLAAQVAAADGTEGADLEVLRAQLREMTEQVRAEKLGDVAAEFENVHTVGRAKQVGSVDRIVAAKDLRPYLIDALERGMTRERERVARTPTVRVEASTGELVLGR